MTRQTLQAKESAPAKKSSFSWLRPAAAHPAAEAEHEAPSASSPAFAHDFNKVPVRPMQLPGVPGFSCPFAPQRCPSGGACHTCPPKLQAKLKIGQPGDQYEQEADRVAETVMRMPEPQVQRKGCSAPGCKEEDEDKKLVQTKPAGGGESRAYIDHPLIQSVLSSPGQPLDAATRSFMEPRFGQDFSGVRVHLGGEAAEAARAVNARAYTVGRDVVFGEGQYAPVSDEGKRLVAHELVHVSQQPNLTIAARSNTNMPSSPVVVAMHTMGNQVQRQVAADVASWALAAAGGLAADDVTGIGVADDVLIPVALGVAGIAGLIALATSTSTTATTDVTTDTTNEETRQTCRRSYPTLRICSSLPTEYVFPSGSAALIAMKSRIGAQNIKLHSPSPTTSGPCPGIGTHYNVRQGGARVGSITCCPCCADSPIGPSPSTRCRIVW